MAKVQTTTLELRAGRNGRQHGKRVVGHAIVLNDAFTADVLRKRRWNLSVGYPATTVKREDGTSARMLLHWFVWENYYSHPRTPGKDVVFVDGDRLNCVPGNLREVTRTESNYGQPRKPGRSGYRNVTWRANGWVAAVEEHGRRIRLGKSETPAECARLVNDWFRANYPGIQIPNPGAEE